MKATYTIHTGKTVAQAAEIRAADPEARVKLTIRDGVSIDGNAGLDADGQAVVAEDYGDAATFAAHCRRAIARDRERLAGAVLTADEAKLAARMATATTPAEYRVPSETYTWDISPWTTDDIRRCLEREIVAMEEWLAAYEAGGAVACQSHQGGWWYI